MATYSAIAKTTVTNSATNTIIFSDIPQNYTDLLVQISFRSATNAGSVWGFGKFLLNGTFYSGGSNAARSLYSNGTAAYSDNASNEAQFVFNGNTSTGSTFSNQSMYIPNYTSSENKRVIVDTAIENNGSTAYLGRYFMTTTLTGAITSLELRDYSNANNIVQHSSATLYGIKNS